MTLYAYRLYPFFLNGWIDAKTFLASFSDIDEDYEYIDAWRARVADRLEMIAVLFLDLGLHEDEGKDGTNDVWFAPLPRVRRPAGRK